MKTLWPPCLASCVEILGAIGLLVVMLMSDRPRACGERIKKAPSIWGFVSSIMGRESGG
jgi:hypothetical protein